MLDKYSKAAYRKTVQQYRVVQLLFSFVLFLEADSRLQTIDSDLEDGNLSEETRRIEFLPLHNYLK